jgi:hypothetical protein
MVTFCPLPLPLFPSFPLFLPLWTSIPISLAHTLPRPLTVTRMTGVQTQTALGAPRTFC